MKKPNFNGAVLVYRMLIGLARCFILHKVFLLSFVFYIFPFYGLQAQSVLKSEIPENTFDQIPVLVIIAGYESFYVDAIYTKNKMLCVNIEDLFKTLKISCKVEDKGNSMVGFIENEKRTYSINYTTKQIKFETKKLNLENGLIKEMGTLYLESSLFAGAFGLNLTFNYRSLSMILKSDFELPVIKLLRNEKMRSNMSIIKNEVVPDTVINRNYHLFRFGTLDWLASSTQIWNTKNYNQFGLAVGTEFLYGELDLSINLYDQQKFNIRQLNYLWSWIDNEKSIIKQAQIGKLNNQTISSIYAPVIGAVIRNSPTTVRKATGYYVLNDVTEPNWTVELYINNVMVDYTKADVSGLYMFKVPIVYGYTILKLKFYGPLGEEQTVERTINVPYTVMPVNEFEYSLSGGIVQDSSLSRLGKAEFNYGVSRLLTIGGGLEYLSSITNAPFIPFATLTMQPFSKLTINAEYAHGVKVGGLLNYYLLKDIILEINYTKYVEGQHATSGNALEERKAKFSFPLKYKKLNGFARFDYTQLVYKTQNYNQADIIFSTYYQQISANSSTQFYWSNQIPTSISSNLSLSYRLKKGYTLRPSVQYFVSKNQLRSFELIIEKYIPKGSLSISYNRNFLSSANTINLNLRYDLNFAKVSLSTTHRNGQIYTSESAQGSLAFGGENKYIHKNSNSSISKGGLALYPFLDLNQNGVFDKNEHFVKLNTVRIFGAKSIFSKKDSIVRIPDLNAFNNYIIELNNNDLNNIAWRFKKNLYQVLIDPNQFKRIDVPIISVGELSGMIYLNTDSSTKGIGRILLKIYNKNSKKFVAETLSESDGYLYYLGLEPGEYIARIDPEQLKILDMESSPAQISFKISQSEEGDIVDGVNFSIRPINKQISDTVNSVTQVQFGKTFVVPKENFCNVKIIEMISGKSAIVVYENQLL